LCGRGVGRGSALSPAGTTTGATSAPVAAAPSSGPLAVLVSAPFVAWPAGVADVLDLFGLQTRVLPTLVLGQLALGALGDVECVEQVCGGGVGLLRLGLLQLECGVDELSTRRLLPVHEGGSGFVASSAPVQTDTVRVGVCGLGGFGVFVM